jgi:hypothetical protein
MANTHASRATPRKRVALAGYDNLLVDIAVVLEDARRTAARAVTSVMTTTYWLVGQRIVEQEQHGASRAGYGDELIYSVKRSARPQNGRARATTWVIDSTQRSLRALPLVKFASR